MSIQSIDGEIKPTNILKRSTSHTQIYRETVPFNTLERSYSNTSLRNQTESDVYERPITPLDESSYMSDDLNELNLTATQSLQMSAQVYIHNQQKIAEDMKEIIEKMKQLDEDFGANMEILQNDYKKGLQTLKENFIWKLKALKNDSEENKLQLTWKMEELHQLNQENKRKFLKSQEEVASLK